MIKIRLHGESGEIEEMVARICNELSGIRVLSVSDHYKDRGTSVYERCYLDVELYDTKKRKKRKTNPIPNNGTEANQPNILIESGEMPFEE